MKASSREVRESCIFVYSPDYYCDIGEHVFPTQKFRLVYEELRRKGNVPEAAFIRPSPVTLEEAALVHSRSYLDDLANCRRTSRTASSELPISEEIVRAYFLGSGGTVAACRAALRVGRAMNLTGGFHHAFPDRAEGFCYLNDVAIAIRVLQNEMAIQKAVIIDCDLHQGNGTAAIFQGDSSVYTFSMHQEDIYPPKEESDLDIGLRQGTSDGVYLGILQRHIPQILDAVRPDIAVYVAGVDPYSGDQLGSLQLTMAGLARRDEIVVAACRARGLPLGAVLGGGYAWDITDTVTTHYNTCLVMLRGSA